MRGIKSGLPVHECLNIIGRESPEPVASEFRILVESISHGMTMDQALERMYQRTPIQELRFFSIVLGIQQKTGGNLAEALSNLSTVLRARKLMREEGQGAGVRSDRLGDDHRLPAAGGGGADQRHHAVLPVDPVRGPARAPDAGRRRAMDGPWHLRHAPHDQLQVLTPWTSSNSWPTRTPSSPPWRPGWRSRPS
ncbi:MAG: type II secretion system F family protein [Caulobacteraceae bacterium]